MTWTAPTPEPADGPLTGPDRPMLEGFLGWQRTTLLNVCAGLTGDQLAERPLPSSNLSLLGLLRHAAKVERTWLRQRAAGEDVEPFYDPDLGPQHDFDHLDPAEAEDAVRLLREEWLDADVAVAAMSFDDTFDVARRGVVAADGLRPPDRGVRPPQRARRPAPRGARRGDRPVSDLAPGPDLGAAVWLAAVRRSHDRLAQRRRRPTSARSWSRRPTPLTAGC